MGKRLPPGEAERRAAERKRVFWAGENYKKYDPAVEGYGSAEEWASAARAFLGGDTKPESRAGIDMMVLGLTVMPVDQRALHSAWKKAVMKLFQEKGSDTAPGYAEGFQALMEASARLMYKNGW